jgi:hypothetical protein
MDLITIFPGLMKTELDWVLGKVQRKENDVRDSLAKNMEEDKEKIDERRRRTTEESGEFYQERLEGF